MSQKPPLPHLMKVEVIRYRKPDGFATKHWAVKVNGELLVVTLYRKGAEAVAHLIANLIVPSESDTLGFEPGEAPVTSKVSPDTVPVHVEPTPCDTDSQPLAQPV